MVKKVLCCVLTIILILSLMSKHSVCADTGRLEISSSPAGADVYIDGNFKDSVSPCTLELPTGTHKVELKIPGYETYTDENVQITTGATTVIDDIVQLPYLVETNPDHTLTVTTLADKVRWSSVSGMNAITVAQLKADTGTPISLREAIQAVKNEPAGSGHYRIEFDASLNGGTISLFRSDGGDFPVEDGLLQNLYIEKRGDMTINGDIDRDGEADITLEPYTNGTSGTPKGSVLNVYASNISLAGLSFEGSESVPFGTLSFRVPDCNTAKYDVDNVRVLGCTFDNSFEIGMGTCGGYGYAGTSYGGAGTTNFTDIVFSGNTFNEAKLFSFAGAGDEDYNVIDGYYVAANSFYNGCVGILAADANTWYVFGKNNQLGNGGVAGQIGFCEHNQIKNIYVTGNHFNHTENADIILLATANLGNSNNLAENLHFRNNTSVVADDLNSSVMVENASIGRDERYTVDEVCHNTANNTMRNVYFEDNDFEIGDSGRFGIYNVQEGCLEDSFMDGTGNFMEKIYVMDNRIQSKTGVFATGIGCFGGAINRDISGNAAQEIVFSGNEIIGKDSEWGTSGLRVTNYYNVKNTHTPDYQDNVMSDITVQDNTISGYYKGIAIAGSFGNEADGQSIQSVTVSGNTVICKPEGEYGIIVTGNLIDDYGGDSYNGCTNCGAKNITVSGNNITAPGGILLTGTYVNSPLKGSLSGNHISSVSVFDNTITKVEGTVVNRPLPGITSADIIETWPRIELGTTLDNNYCKELTIQDNTITGFNCSVLDISSIVSEYPIGGSKTANEILSDIKSVTNEALGDNSMDWQWYGDTFLSVDEGSFTAVARRNVANGFDFMYKCVNVIDTPDCSIAAQPNNTVYGSVIGGGTYNIGASVTLKATANAGYHFVRWTEGGTQVSANSDYSFTVVGDRTLVAVFEKDDSPQPPTVTPVSVSCSKTDVTTFGGSDGSVTISASGGNSGAYEFSINGGASWQTSNTFGGLGAATYTAAVRDAGNTGNMATCSVTIGQPTHVGTVPANKISSKANAGTAVTVVPPAPPKGYTLQSTAFSSSNPSVATVDANGNVTFKTGGKVTIITTIISTTVDKKGKVKTKITTVKKTITVKQPVASVTLNTDSATIARKGKVKLAASIAPGTASNKKLKWKSSNPKIASVSGAGVVTGKAGGTAVITCTAKDGSNVSASCNVTVTPIYPVSVKLSKTVLTMKAGKTGALKATVAPKNTDFKTVTWASSNPAVATVDAKGKIKALSAGTTVITVTASGGQTALCSVTVS